MNKGQNRRNQISENLFISSPYLNKYSIQTIARGLKAKHSRRKQTKPDQSCPPLKSRQKYLLNKIRPRTLDGVKRLVPQSNFLALPIIKPAIREKSHSSSRNGGKLNQPTRFTKLKKRKDKPNLILKLGEKSDSRLLELVDNNIAAVTCESFAKTEDIAALQGLKEKERSPHSLIKTLGEMTANIPSEEIFSSICFRKQAGLKNGTLKVNQDYIFFDNDIIGNDRSCLLGIFDGHGEYGHKVSKYLAKNIKGIKTM